MNAIRTSLRNAPGDSASETELEAMRRDAWLQQGIAVIRPTDPLDDFVRQAVINFANKQWGKRNGR